MSNSPKEEKIRDFLTTVQGSRLINDHILSMLEEVVNEIELTDNERTILCNIEDILILNAIATDEVVDKLCLLTKIAENRMN